ncbi:hypothetical protein PHMEG_00019171 [Phytophthora megakarya]|uniref:Ubiquitin-like protease family profile domain-containing protein n=1 Tax=Phytophthora megakarya TaxID=4795 RepID=A0A225VS75_9STRA|nr:hypothetical protein PHMEG_00019171 [Phytophthora megakarya]
MKTTARERDSKWSVSAETGRRQAGEVIFRGLLTSLIREQPGLVETQRRLAGIIVKKSRTNYGSVFPAPLQASGSLPEAVVYIEYRGKRNCNFSRSHTETFKRVEILKVCVQLGLNMHKLHIEYGLPSPHPSAPQQADFQYSILDRANPPSWLSDAAIRACCERLMMDYPHCRYSGFIAATVKTKHTRTCDEVPVDSTMRDRILCQVGEPRVNTVLIALSFGNAHWCCVVINVQAKCIFYYDHLNQYPYRSAESSIWTHLKIRGLHDYDVIAQNNPIQFDTFRCGVYTCWMFIRQCITGLHVDMSITALPIRRFELFLYMLTGCILPTESQTSSNGDGMEEESETPPKEHAQDDTEEVPPTQAAQ